MIVPIVFLLLSMGCTIFGSDVMGPLVPLGHEADLDSHNKFVNEYYAHVNTKDYNNAVKLITQNKSYAEAMTDWVNNAPIDKKMTDVLSVTSDVYSGAVGMSLFGYLLPGRYKDVVQSPLKLFTKMKLGYVAATFSLSQFWNYLRVALQGRSKEVIKEVNDNALKALQALVHVILEKNNQKPHTHEFVPGQFYRFVADHFLQGGMLLARDIPLSQDLENHVLFLNDRLHDTKSYAKYADSLIQSLYEMNDLLKQSKKLMQATWIGPSVDKFAGYKADEIEKILLDEAQNRRITLHNGKSYTEYLIHWLKNTPNPIKALQGLAVFGGMFLLGMLLPEKPRSLLQFPAMAIGFNLFMDLMRNKGSTSSSQAASGS